MSLRWRLTLLITAILALAIGAVTISAVVLTTRATMTRIEAAERERVSVGQVRALQDVLTGWQPGQGLDDAVIERLTGDSIVIPTAVEATLAGALGARDIPGYTLSDGHEFPDPLDLNPMRLLPDDEPFRQKSVRLGGREVLVTARYFTVGADRGGDDFGTFTVASIVDVADAMAPVRDTRRWLLIAALPGLALGAMVSWLIASRIERPVRAASHAASAMAAGDFTGRVDVSGPPELQAMGRAFNAMASRIVAMITDLRASDERHRRFAADAAHELRTPTATLLATAGALAAREPDDPAIARLVPALRRLAGLSESLLELDRLDSGGVEPLPERLDIGDFVRTVAADVGLADDVVVRAFGDCTALADPRILGTAFANVLRNGATHGKPPISVRIDGTESEAIVVDIEDDGDGMDDAFAATAFDRFARADSSRASRGNGLGLALARESVRLHGGEITVIDPQHALLRISLPRGGLGVEPR